MHYLIQNNYLNAFYLLSSITPFNDVESNYVEFYTLYANYQHDMDNRDPFSSSDSLDLLTLSYNCPEEGGNCVYQARALYEYIFATAPYYPGCDSGTGARTATLLSTSTSLNNLQSEIFKILPNPNEGSFAVEIGANVNNATLRIYDCTGALKLEKIIQFQNARSNIQFDLAPGLYELVLTSATGERTSRKVIISK